jgi:hypothetical protein
MKKIAYIIMVVLLTALPVSAQTYYQTYTQTYPTTYTSPGYYPQTGMTTMGYGSAGASVVQLQQILKQQGYFPINIPATGFYGWTTVRAVQQFQRAHGILATGAVGTRTLAALSVYTGGGNYSPYPPSPVIPNYTTCLPSGTQLEGPSQVSVDALGGSSLTVKERLDSLRARCSYGTLYDYNNHPIYFYQMTGCWGNAPYNYEEILAEQDAKIAQLSQHYTVILISCNPSGALLY